MVTLKSDVLKLPLLSVTFNVAVAVFDKLTVWKSIVPAVVLDFVTPLNVIS